jgi:hypothetical protein
LKAGGNRAGGSDTEEVSSLEGFDSGDLPDEGDDQI